MEGGEGDDRNFEEKPIKTKGNANTMSKNPPRKN